MELTKQIADLRTRCEEQFYMLSAELDEEQAKRLAPLVVKSIIESEIRVHEQFIGTSKTVIENRKEREKMYERRFFNTKFERGMENGAQVALEGRIHSHQTCIIGLKKDLEILKLNLL